MLKQPEPKRPTLFVVAEEDSSVPLSPVRYGDPFPAPFPKWVLRYLAPPLRWEHDPPPPPKCQKFRSLFSRKTSKKKSKSKKKGGRKPRKTRKK